MRTIVLSKETMLEVASILQPIIAGEARFFSKGINTGPDMDDIPRWEPYWQIEKFQTVTQVQNEKNMQIEELRDECLLLLYCNMNAYEMLFVGDILYVVDDNTILIKRADYPYNYNGEEYLIISLIRKFEGLSKCEIMDAAYMEKASRHESSISNESSEDYMVFYHMDGSLEDLHRSYLENQRKSHCNSPMNRPVFHIDNEAIWKQVNASEQGEYFDLLDADASLRDEAGMEARFDSLMDEQMRDS